MIYPRSAYYLAMILPSFWEGISATLYLHVCSWGFSHCQYDKLLSLWHDGGTAHREQGVYPFLSVGRLQ